MLAYHIDRRQTLLPNSEIQLQNVEFPSLLTLTLNNEISYFGSRYIPNQDYILMSNLGDYHSHIIEMTFELFRAAYYPNEISRLSSFFFTNESSLNKWQKMFGNEPTNIFTADIPESNPFDATFLKSPIGPNSVYPNNLYENASLYWSHTMSDDPIIEYLVKPPVKINELYKGNV